MSMETGPSVGATIIHVGFVRPLSVMQALIDI